MPLPVAVLQHGGPGGGGAESVGVVPLRPAARASRCLRLALLLNPPVEALARMQARELVGQVVLVTAARDAPALGGGAPALGGSAPALGGGAPALGGGAPSPAAAGHRDVTTYGKARALANGAVTGCAPGSTPATVRAVLHQRLGSSSVVLPTDAERWPRLLRLCARLQRSTAGALFAIHLPSPPPRALLREIDRCEQSYCAALLADLMNRRSSTGSEAAAPLRLRADEEMLLLRPGQLVLTENFRTIEDKIYAAWVIKQAQTSCRHALFRLKLLLNPPFKQLRGGGPQNNLWVLWEYHQPPSSTVLYALCGLIVSFREHLNAAGALAKRRAQLEAAQVVSNILSDRLPADHPGPPDKK